mgnify:CR=1 FL=1
MSQLLPNHIAAVQCHVINLLNEPVIMREALDELSFYFTETMQCHLSPEECGCWNIAITCNAKPVKCIDPNYDLCRIENVSIFFYKDGCLTYNATFNSKPLSY